MSYYSIEKDPYPTKFGKTWSRNAKYVYAGLALLLVGGIAGYKIAMSVSRQEVDELKLLISTYKAKQKMHAKTLLAERRQKVAADLTSLEGLCERNPGCITINVSEVSQRLGRMNTYVNSNHAFNSYPLSDSFSPVYFGKPLSNILLSQLTGDVVTIKSNKESSGGQNFDPLEFAAWRDNSQKYPHISYAVGHAMQNCSTQIPKDVESYWVAAANEYINQRAAPQSKTRGFLLRP